MGPNLHFVPDFPPALSLTAARTGLYARELPAICRWLSACAGLLTGPDAARRAPDSTTPCPAKLLQFRSGRERQYFRKKAVIADKFGPGAATQGSAAVDPHPRPGLSPVLVDDRNVIESRRRRLPDGSSAGPIRGDLGAVDVPAQALAGGGQHQAPRRRTVNVP